ncbi:peptidylprolyl isomerase [Thalassovita sp.]|uniref:peptidylprolyl isomerase n=1 Tax=Thalassovita sp. TaxID=1979401 RepID=UPI0029DE754E|nr:SurA N-terminal domain-containing protein [Thalassovita sp.]
MARGGTTKILVWILMAMLILGLGGFGVSSLSGNIRSVGAAGDEKISVQEYGRALQEEIRSLEARTGQSVTFQQAQAFGLDRSVLGRLIGAAALDNEAAQIGLSMGDENLQRQILQMGAFQGPDGKFDREAYRFALSQNNLTESEFEAEMRAESARGLLQGAVISGAVMPDIYVDTLMSYIAERRSFTWAIVGADALTTPLPAPTEEQLTAYHADNTDAFTTPRMKTLTYVWLSPDMLLDTVEVSEDQIRAQYEANAADYMRPERRLVERLAFSDEEIALAAKGRIETGETTFETIVTDRGLQLSDIDLGDVAKEDLADAGGAVFNAAVGDVVGPFKTALGPALFRVNGILAAQETSLDDARQEIRDDLAADAARRMIETRAETVDDLLAGGATLEELVAEAGMELHQIGWHADAEDQINGYAAFRDAAEAVQDGDYPQVIRLDDGGIAALRLEGVVEPALKPLAEVRDEVIAGWQAAETTKALNALAQDMVGQLATEGDIAALGLTAQVETGVTRNEFVTGAPQGFLQQVFAMARGDTTVIAGAEVVTIVRLDDILPPDMDNADVKATRDALVQDVAGSLAQDIYAAYALDVQNRAGITIDQAALNAVHANFQ